MSTPRKRLPAGSWLPLGYTLPNKRGRVEVGAVCPCRHLFSPAGRPSPHAPSSPRAAASAACPLPLAKHHPLRARSSLGAMAWWRGQRARARASRKRRGPLSEDALSNPFSEGAGAAAAAAATTRRDAKSTEESATVELHQESAAAMPVPGAPRRQLLLERRHLLDFMLSHVASMNPSSLQGADIVKLVSYLKSVEDQERQRRSALVKAATNIHEAPARTSNCYQVLRFMLQHPEQQISLDAKPEDVLRWAAEAMDADVAFEDYRRTNMETALERLLTCIKDPEFNRALTNEHETLETIVPFMVNNTALFTPEMLLRQPEELVRSISQKIAEEKTRIIAISSAAKVLLSEVPHAQLFRTLVLNIFSPEGLCESMSNFSENFQLLGLRLQPKDNTQANRLVEEPIFPLKDRDDVLAKILKSLRTQPVKHTDKNTKKPLIFVCGAPGSGKSRVLDELMNTFEENLSGKRGALSDLVGPKVGRQTSCTSVTWNGHSVYPVLILTYITRHWFQTKESDYETFFQCIANWDQIEANIDTALDTLIQAMALQSRKKYLLLCVDEILKTDENLRDDGNSRKICHKLASLLDKYSKKKHKKEEDKKYIVLMIVMSCLNEGWVAERKTESVRLISHKLEPLVFDSRQKLFKSHFRHPGVKAGLMKALSDTGGHACLLVGLQGWLTMESESAYSLLQRKVYCLNAIVSRTRSIFQMSLYPYEIISAVISAKQLASSSLIGRRTFSELIASGVIFSKGSVPCLSVMNLLCFSNENLEYRPSVDKDNPKEFTAIAHRLVTVYKDPLPAIKTLLKVMLNPESDWSTGKPLEDFLSLHPLLLTLCNSKQDDRTFSLSEMFGNPFFITEDFPDLEVNFPRTPKFLCWNVEVPVSPGMSRKHSFVWWAKKKVDSLTTGTVIRCNHTNPGFETAFLLNSVTGKKVVVCLETKYYEIGSTSSLSPREIRNKWDKTKKQMQPLMENPEWEGLTLVLICVALGKLASRFRMPNDLDPGANIVVVDRAGLISYLGPTMSCRLDAIVNNNPALLKHKGRALVHGRR
ncbi:hypothetical protein Pelo_4983 [Pelomyxa schiedti]|nr:hypothetical protein Pelo_4983 [Pelomyxa schiedti]